MSYHEFIESNSRLQLKKIMDKLSEHPLSITTEDARRLVRNLRHLSRREKDLLTSYPHFKSETFEAKDVRSAKIISAVNSLAIIAQDVHETVPSLGQGPKMSLLTVVEDLKAAVDNAPHQVTGEILKTTQSVVSKMQRAVGQTNASHPELEAELQAEYAKIEPKVEQGTVTKDEAGHLHSLEARARGHTEKGGLTAVAQSVAAKRERALSLSDSTNKSPSIAPMDNAVGKEINGKMEQLAVVGQS